MKKRPGMTHFKKTNIIRHTHLMTGAQAEWLGQGSPLFALMASLKVKLWKENMVNRNNNCILTVLCYMCRSIVNHITAIQCVNLTGKLQKYDSGVIIFQSIQNTGHCMPKIQPHIQFVSKCVACEQCHPSLGEGKH